MRVRPLLGGAPELLIQPVQIGLLVVRAVEAGNLQCGDVVGHAEQFEDLQRGVIGLLIPQLLET